MARRSYARSSRRSRGPSRRPYGSATSRRSYRSRSTASRRGAGRRSTGARTIRIEVVAPAQSAVARPEIGMMPAGAKRKASM